MTNFPCPNPSCTHTFTAEEVQSTDVLKCPRCGGQYNFRQPGSSPPPGPRSPVGPAKPPSARPVPTAKQPLLAAPTAMPPPLAAPVVPAVPLAMPVAPLARPVVGVPNEQPVGLPEAATAFESDGHVPLVRARGVIKNRWTTKHFVVLGIGAVVLTVLIICAIVFRGNIRDLFRPGGDRIAGGGRTLILHARNLSGKDEKCLGITIPEGWSIDKDLKANLNALMAWKQDEAWFAVAAHDYGQQRPRDSEMMRAAVERLETHFGEALELANKTTKAQLADEDCQCLRFKGTVNSVTWHGECYLLAHHGFGYWIFVASSARWDTAGDAAQIKSELEKGNGLMLVTDRKGWREQPPKMETFRNQDATFTMTVPAGAWEKNAANSEEPTGQLYLLGWFKKEKDNRKNASMQVFTSAKKSDLRESLREARSHLEKRKQEENDKYKYLIAEDGTSEVGAAEPVGDRLGYVVELKLTLKDEPKRYALLAVAHHDDKAYVVLCDCAWEHRQIWQQDFRNAMATLKFARKE